MAKTETVKSEKMEIQSSMASQKGMDIATTRAAQEVQAAMVVAKKFPRDIIQAEKRILEACKRPALAEQAMYAYPRGGTTVEGPSIRLAEVLSQNWGNIDTGIIELEQSDGESTMMAYCWDLETNTRQTKIFTVKHERHTKKGVTDLKDPRDIYEMTANQGARRQRACILGVIPGDIVDQAVKTCNDTLRGNQKEPIIDRAKKMLKAFETMNVTKGMIEKRLGHVIDTINETEILNLGKIFKAIQDNMQPVEAYFGDDAPKQTQTGSLDVADVLGKATEETDAPGGTEETAPRPQEPAEPVTEDSEPIEDPDDLISDADEPPSPVVDEEDPISEPPEATDEPESEDEEEAGQSLVDQAVSAWKAKLKELHKIDASMEFAKRQVNDFCVNYWVKMDVDEVADKKPAWISKLIGFIENTPGDDPMNTIPLPRFAFELQQEKKRLKAEGGPKRPNRRK